MDLSNCTYLVTGASSGIGYQTAKILVKYGARVLLIDINKDSLLSVTEELGPNATSLCYDLSKIDNQLYANILEYAQKNGGINGFIHCAGISYITPIAQINKDKTIKVIEINTIAALQLSKIITKKAIRASQNCSSVLISSIYGLVGSAANAAYAISKGGINALTKALAIEFAPKNIRFNCIAPGFVKTAMLANGSKSFDNNYISQLESAHPLGLGTGEDIAETIAFLLSSKSKWITGAIIPVDGGFTAK